MNNEKEINKSHTNSFKRNKIDISANSEDIAFMNLKENHPNKSEPSLKYKGIKQNIFESQNKFEKEEHMEKEINNTNEENNEKDNFIDIKQKKENLNKEIIEQDKNSIYELDDLIDKENNEKKSQNNDNKIEENNNNKNNSANHLDKVKYDNTQEIKLNNNINIIYNKVKENHEIMSSESKKELKKIIKEELNSKNNNNQEKKKEPEKEEQNKKKLNQINKNLSNNIINIDPINYNPQKIEIQEEKVSKENSKENLQEKTEEKNISSQNMVKKSNTLDEIGQISSAKIHRDANRILKQINKFNKNTKFCPCCCLPTPTPGVLEKFSYCDNTDDFIETGQGTSLYFFFFKYSMIIMAATAVIIGIPFLFFSYQYTYSMQKLCNNYYNNRNNEAKNLMEYCELYITEEEFADDYYSVVDSPFFLFSSVNIKDYRNMFYKLYNSDETNFEKSILNYPLMNLICSIALLIVNILYIIIIYNKSMVYDFQLTSPSDYTVMVTNMKKLLTHYLNIKKKYEEMQLQDPNKLNEDGTPFDFQKNLREELGLSEIKTLKEDKNKQNKKRTISNLEEFSAFLENNICVDTNKEKYNVQQINICFKLNKYMNLEEQLQLKKTQKVKIEKHPYQIKKNTEKGYTGDNRRYFSSMLSYYNLWCSCCDNGIPLSQIEKEIPEIEQGITDLMKASEDINQKNFAGVAFISFNTLKEQEDFLSQFPSNIFSYFIKYIKDLKYIFCFCCFKKNLKTNLDAQKAPEPEDVIYENLEYSYIEGNFRTFIVYIISIVLIIICFGIYIGINILQDKINDKAIHQILSYVISLINTCVSSALNFFFQMILDFLTKMEKQYTMTEYYRSYSVKLTLFSFFTSAVVPLICELIKNSDGYQILISNMLMMFLVNAFVTPIMWTMNFTYFLKKFRIWTIERKVNPDSRHNMTQRELNDLYELPSMSISYKYSYLAKTLLMTFLYIPIFPLGIVISLVGFILGYLLEKFNYAHMYKRPEMLNHKLCVFYVNHLDVIFFVYAIGDYIFMHNAYKNKIIPLVKIIVFGVITIIPYKKLLKRNYIGILESDISKNEYKDKYFTFSMDYERANPISRKKGIKHYLEKMLKFRKIDKKKYLELISEIDSLNLMELYYKTRENRYLFDVQKGFAKAMGKKFLNLRRELNKNNGEEENKLKNNKDENLYIKDENIESDRKDNVIDIKSKENDENEIKEQKEQKEIANMYNNPNFMEIGCMMQLYQQVIEKKENKSNDNIDNDNIINREEEDKKQIILLKDKI